MKILSLLAVFLPITPIASGATITVDSFVEEGFVLSLSGETGTSSLITGPIGTQRSAKISSRNVAVGSLMTSILDANAGELSLEVDGSSTSSSLLQLGVSYVHGGPYSILGYSAFEFDFSSLAGTGNLIIELGSQTTPDEDTARVALTGPGTVSVPFDDLNYAPGEGPSAFNAMHFTFEAFTEEFAFTLDEIRIVPEPSVLVLLAIGSIGLLKRRRYSVPSHRS